MGIHTNSLALVYFRNNTFNIYAVCRSIASHRFDVSGINNSLLFMPHAQFISCSSFGVIYTVVTVVYVFSCFCYTLPSLYKQGYWQSILCHCILHITLNKDPSSSFVVKVTLNRPNPGQQQSIRRPKTYGLRTCGQMPGNRSLKGKFMQLWSWTAEKESLKKEKQCHQLRHHCVL